MKNLNLPCWYVLYVRYRHEKKVEKKLNDQQFEVFLPMTRSIRIWSDRKKKILKPLFPCYVFVMIRTKLEFYDALSVDGVVKYLRFGLDYAQVRANEISQIKQLLNLETISDISCIRNLPERGQKMKINYGALKGLNCEVINTKKHSNIFVKIDSIRHIITACVPIQYLTPILSSNGE